jgi:hypothetical protein
MMRTMFGRLNAAMKAGRSSMLGLTSIILADRSAAPATTPPPRRRGNCRYKPILTPDPMDWRLLHNGRRFPATIVHGSAPWADGYDRVFGLAVQTARGLRNILARWDQRHGAFVVYS